MTKCAGSLALGCFTVQVACTDGIWAMPSARALLVASLLTEPPYGRLGPSGNDRYRKRSETAGLRKLAAKSRRLLRSESATSRRFRAGAHGGSTAMTRTAFCRKSPRLPGVGWGWALGISDQENTTAGRRDKRGSPVEPQAIGMARVLPCRSVGARAAPCVLTNAIKGIFGPVCALDRWEALP